MADYNWAADAGSTKTSTPSKTGSGIYGTTGSTTDIFDNNMATYQSASIYAGSPTYNISATVIAQSDFALVHTINSVVLKISLSGYYQSTGNISISLYYANAWNEVYSDTPNVPYPAGYSTTITMDSLNLSGVSKIKSSATCFSNRSGGTITSAYCGVYELQAWGPKYIDIGLRVRSSSGTVNVGVADASEMSLHKLRIRKGGTTYGIPLLATTDADACGLRIYDGTSVKSLPKVT